MTRRFALGLTLVAGVGAAFLFATCKEPAAPPPKELLVVDGLTIELAELDPYVQFLDSYLPEGGRKAKVRRVLEEHLLPLHLARRAFAAERAEQFRRATDLCTVATNVAELEVQSKSVPDRTRKHWSRSQAKLPVAMFLFDPLHTGAVSPPLEVPHGWIVAAAYAIEQSALTVDDHVDALQVAFATHTADRWTEWVIAEQRRIADKVTFVHPDYREAMPPWLVLPKLP